MTAADAGIQQVNEIFAIMTDVCVSAVRRILSQEAVKYKSPTAAELMSFRRAVPLLHKLRDPFEKDGAPSQQPELFFFF